MILAASICNSGIPDEQNKHVYLIFYGPDSPLLHLRGHFGLHSGLPTAPSVRKNSGMRCGHQLLLKGVLNWNHLSALKFFGGRVLAVDAYLNQIFEF